MKKALTGFILIVVVFLAACNSTASVTPTPLPPTEVSPTAQPEVEEVEPTAETVMIVDDELLSTTWAWVSFTNPENQYTLSDPEKYTLTFDGNGSVSIVADCNNTFASYAVQDGQISIDMGITTLAACPPDSQSDDFVMYLGFASNYFFENGQLIIDLMADGCTLAFSPVDQLTTVTGDEELMTNSLPEHLTKQLDTYLLSQVYSDGGDPERAAPGLVLYVETPDGRYLNAAGVSSIESGTPMQTDDILEIGSNSKSFTIVVLMQLQEEGVLSFDDLLMDWLPEIAADIPNGDIITLYQLANHTSGIWDYGDAIIGEAANDPEKLEASYTPEELVQYAIDNGTPDFEPGTNWKYSNTGYVLLGMIAEKATGQSLSELYQTRIFDPLGLETAHMISGVPTEDELTSQGYWWKEDGTRLNTTNWNVSQGWAAGGISMTAEDLATYGKALSKGELFTDSASLEQMTTFNDAALYIGGAPFGLGLIDFGNGYFGHEGATAGFQSLWFINPEEGITVVGLTNSGAYKGYYFLNVRNLLTGKGLQPLSEAALLPIGEAAASFLSTHWEWQEKIDAEGKTTITAGTQIILRADGNASIKGEGCGVALGTFTTTGSSIEFSLDDSPITCTGDEPVVKLLNDLKEIESWRFENGYLFLVLQDGTSLRFQSINPEQ